MKSLHIIVFLYLCFGSFVGLAQDTNNNTEKYPPTAALSTPALAVEDVQELQVLLYKMIGGDHMNLLVEVANHQDAYQPLTRVLDMVQDEGVAVQNIDIAVRPYNPSGELIAVGLVASQEPTTELNILRP